MVIHLPSSRYLKESAEHAALNRFPNLAPAYLCDQSEFVVRASLVIPLSMAYRPEIFYALMSKVCCVHNACGPSSDIAYAATYRAPLSSSRMCRVRTEPVPVPASLV